MDVRIGRTVLIPGKGKKMNKFKMALVAAVSTFTLGMALITPGQAAPPDGAGPQPTPTPVPACASAPPVAQGTPVIFVAAHPDDETLAMAVPLAEHAGQDVHVLILTSGGASAALGVVNDELPASYAPLTQAAFMAARENEAERAVAKLGCGYQTRLHFAHLEDGQVTTAKAKAEILALADELTTGPVRLKGHSYISAVEPHADHRAVGNAIVELGTEQPARFADRRFYVLPHAWGYTGALPGKAWDTPANADVTTRVHLAAGAYCLWAPPVSYSIGCLSVPGMFATLNATPKALVHQ